MDAKKFLGPAILVPLTLVEAFHFRESEASGQPAAPSVASASHTLALLPHSHSDLPIEGHATTVATSFASGGQRQQELFQLVIVPVQTGFRLAAHPAFEWNQDAQLMYGFCATLEDLLDRLSSKLTDAQLTAIRRRFQSGSSQEVIGGQGTPLRVFHRKELERLGMTFRPLD